MTGGSIARALGRPHRPSIGRPACHEWGVRNGGAVYDQGLAPATGSPAGPTERDPVNDLLQARLTEQLDPDHECSPENGSCDMPHYRFNYTLPHYVSQWPEASDALTKLDELRELRDLEGE